MADAQHTILVVDDNEDNLDLLARRLERKGYAVVRAMKLNDYPEPEVRPLGPEDAASILLDPSRLLADYGSVEVTDLDQIARLAVDRWRQEGVVGGYTHLKEVRGEIRA